MSFFINQASRWLWMCVLVGCARAPQTPLQAYPVDPTTPWHTIDLTPEGMHYGLDLNGVSRNGPILTAWLQRRSANSPYLYDKWQISVHCATKQVRWLLRTVIENDQLLAVEHEVSMGWEGDVLRKTAALGWQPVRSESREEKVLEVLCQRPSALRHGCSRGECESRF